jgi:hypothetical protein
MKLVRESLNFERKGDIKKNLNIGKYSYDLPMEMLFKIMHEEAKKCKYFTEVSDINYENKEPVFSIKTSYKIEKKNRNYGYIYKEFSLYLTKFEGIICIDEWTTDEEKLKNLGDFKIHTNCQTSEEEIKESLNFERGIEPLKKMEIGKESIDKKIIAETEWFTELPEDVWDMELIRDYKGFPIIIYSHLVKSHLNNKSYPRYSAMSPDIKSLPQLDKKDALEFITSAIDKFLEDGDYYFNSPSENLESLDDDMYNP